MHGLQKSLVMSCVISFHVFKFQVLEYVSQECMEYGIVKNDKLKDFNQKTLSSDPKIPLKILEFDQLGYNKVITFKEEHNTNWGHLPKAQFPTLSLMWEISHSKAHFTLGVRPDVQPKSSIPIGAKVEIGLKESRLKWKKYFQSAPNI